MMLVSWERVRRYTAPTFRAVVTLVALLVASNARGGDYWLLVRDGPGPCTRNAPRPLKPTVWTSAETIANLERDLVIEGSPSGYFSNARITFCTSRERVTFERALANLGARRQLRAEREWRDVVCMFGTRDLLAALDEQFARTDLAPRARRRLEDVRARLARWLESKQPWWE